MNLSIMCSADDTSTPTSRSIVVPIRQTQQTLRNFFKGINIQV